MIGSNLRHLRVFLSVFDTGSITRAAEICHVSQPAVTQAVAKLEAAAETALFQRRTHGFFPTEAGEILQRRVARAMAGLDGALDEVAPRLKLTATRAQLQALIAAVEAQNFSLAARKLGIAQPTVHRAITQLEREAGRALFQRSPFGIVPSRTCASLARRAQLAFVELEQARAELGEIAGREVGQIVIGAMPLSRSHVLPRALVEFRRLRPHLPVRLLEGTYDELLAGLRRGEIDFLIGALRNPAPIEDVRQERLFDDTLVVLAGQGHPLLGSPLPPPGELLRWPWLVPRASTPTRAIFDAHFARAGLAPPPGLIETGSVMLMREVLQDARHLACVSRAQAEGEIERGLVQVLDADFGAMRREIGLSLREGWDPTPAQSVMLDCVRRVTGAL